jgi:hypothetical protein
VVPQVPTTLVSKQPALSSHIGIRVEREIQNVELCFFFATAAHLPANFFDFKPTHALPCLTASIASTEATFEVEIAAPHNTVLIYIQLDEFCLEDSKL